MNRTSSRVLWTWGVLIALLLGGSPALAQESTESDADSDSGRGQLYAEFATWVAQPVGLEFTPASQIDPNEPFSTDLLQQKFGTDPRYRNRVGYSFGKAGSLTMTWFSHEDSVELQRLTPGQFIFGQTLTVPLNAGFFEDGLSDGFNATAATKLRDFRLDYGRDAFSTERVRGSWFVGVRRVFHRRTEQATYFTLIHALPPLIGPIVGSSRPDLLPNSDQAFLESRYNGRGAEVGFDIEVDLWNGKILLETGVLVGVLRGTINSAYRSQTWLYATIDGSGAQNVVLAPPYSELEDPVNPMDPMAGLIVDITRQFEVARGLETEDLSTTSSVLESHLGFRWRAWKGLEVLAGFRGARYDRVGADVRPGTPILGPNGILNLTNVVRIERSAGYEGYYLGVAYRY